MILGPMFLKLISFKGLLEALVVFSVRLFIRNVPSVALLCAFMLEGNAMKRDKHPILKPEIVL
jgi:hypothetical protein